MAGRPASTPPRRLSRLGLLLLLLGLATLVLVRGDAATAARQQHRQGLLPQCKGGIQLSVSIIRASAWTFFFQVDLGSIDRPIALGG